MQKNCSDKECQQVNPQPLESFGKRPGRPNGLQSKCKACQKRRYQGKYTADPEKHRARSREWARLHPEQKRKSKLKVRFNITLEEYNELFAEQKGCCFICDRYQSEFKVALGVDHCHVTSVIRGLLCKPCNMALGLFKDNIGALEKAIYYLKKPKLTLVANGR